jgi:competence ComEA-like helix-hairpin-helix protein
MHRDLVLCALAAVALLTAAPPALRGSAEAAARRQASPADEQTTRRVCVNCHGEGHLSARRSRDQWMEVVDRMAAMGADMNDNEYEAIIRYLVATSGRVNINRDPARDLAAVLHLSASDAERIVEYRKANGPFEDLEELFKVPSIDVERVKQRLDAIVF